MPDGTVKVRWQPKQRIAWNLWDGPLIRRLAIGGARGGSKSAFLRHGSLLRRFKYAGSAGLILRRTLPELERSHLLKLFREYPHLRRFYNEQKKMLSLPNGSVQVFASAPTAKDMGDFYSAEFADICVDEAQEFSQDELERLVGSNRCTDNAAIVSKMIFAFMPGMSESGLPPVGLQYLKRVFVDKDLRGQEQSVRWDFVQAFAWDNIEWARPLLEREGFTENDWCSWSEEERKNFFKRTEFGAQLLSGEEWVRNASEREIARRAVALCDQFSCRPETFRMSWDAFGKLSKHTQQPITKLVNDALPEGFPPPFPTDSSPGSRIARARFMKQCLADGRWKVSRTCTKLIECIPNLVRDMERNPEDVLKVDWSETRLGDDPYDAASYGLQYKSGFTPQIPKPEAPVASGPHMAFKMKEMIEGMDRKTDPTGAVYLSSNPRRRARWR